VKFPTLALLSVVAAALAAATAVGGALWYRQRATVEVQPEPVRIHGPEPVVRVTEAEVTVDGKRVLGLDSLEEQAVRGVNAQFKARGPNDLEVVPLVEALRRRRTQGTQWSKPLAIELDPRTPYRVMMEVLFSAHQGGADRFLLSTPAAGAHPSVEFESAAPLPMPKVSKPAEPSPTSSGAATALPERSRDASSHAGVFIVRDGVSLKFQGRNVMPGCKEFGAGVAIPKGDGYELPALVACLKRLNSDPTLAVRDAWVAANPGVEVATVLAIASTLRCGEPSCHGRQLGLPFIQEVTFGVLR
jgi:hypothetical protein